MLSYGGNHSFSGFQGLQESIQRLAERPGAWPSRTGTQTHRVMQMKGFL